MIWISETPLTPVTDQFHTWIGGATPLPWPFLTSGLMAGPVAVLVISIWSVVTRHYLGINIKFQNQKNIQCEISSVWLSREDCVDESKTEMIIKCGIRCTESLRPFWESKNNVMLFQVRAERLSCAHNITHWIGLVCLADLQWSAEICSDLRHLGRPLRSSRLHPNHH